MKKLYVIIICSLVLFVGSVSARCIGPVVNGNCLGTVVQGDDDEPQQSYRGTSGNQYQYDLNKPTDQNRYGYDYDAQRRDQMSANPGRNTDRQNGIYGGGIEDPSDWLK